MRLRRGDYRRFDAIRVQNLTARHTWADMLAVWQAADDIDIYESGWTFDHFYPIFGNSSGPCLEGWTTLTRMVHMLNRCPLDFGGRGRDTGCRPRLLPKAAPAQVRGGPARA